MAPHGPPIDTAYDRAHAMESHRLVDAHASLRELLTVDRPALPPLGVVLGALVCLLPCVTSLRLGSVDPNAAVLDTPLSLLVVGILATLGLHLAARDGWLGAFVIYASLSAWRAHGPLALHVALMIGLGAWMLAQARAVGAVWRGYVVGGCLVVGMLEVGYAGLQRAGYDPLWPVSAHQVHGTFGNSAYLGAWLALLLPLAWRARWVVPLVLAMGLVLAHSVLAVVAAAAGIVVACRMRRVAAVVGMAGVLAVVIGMRTTGIVAWAERVAIWRLGLGDMAGSWIVVLLGWGPGSWYVRVPATHADVVDVWKVVYGQAHNEYLQLFYEFGAIGVLIVGAWLWRHRTALRRSGSAVALLILALGFFPLHLATVGGLAVVLLGFALADGDDAPVDRMSDWRRMPDDWRPVAQGVRDGETL